MAEGGLSNWGRWGPEDEAGAFHLLTPERVRRAAGLVRTGRVYPLGVPIERRGPQWPTRYPPLRITAFSHNPDPEGLSGSDDILVLHSHTATHIDALAHVWYGDRLYNGFPARSAVQSGGVRRCGIHNLPYLVGRGVLLDIARWKGVEHLGPGEPVTAEDLSACARAQGVEPGPGDILLVRTGWYRLFHRDRALFDSAEPGLDPSTLPWIHARDIVAVGADNGALEAIPRIPPQDLPVHRVLLRDLGVYILEYLDLEALSADGVHEFLFVASPLRLVRAVGSPVNPLAIA